MRTDPRRPAGDGGAAAGAAAALVNAQAAVDCETTHFTPGWSLEKRSDPIPARRSIRATRSPTPDRHQHLHRGGELGGGHRRSVRGAAVRQPRLRTCRGDPVGHHADLDRAEHRAGRAAAASYTVTVDDDAYDVSFANVATPGNGGECTRCTTTHETPPAPDNPDNPDNPDESNLPNTGGTSLLPLGLGAGFG